MDTLMDLGSTFFVIFAVFALAIVVLMLVSMWKVFEKAGQPGWAILIPIYNVLTLLKVAQKPWWWIFGVFLAIIPFLGIVLIIVWEVIIYHSISKNFGKDAGFTVGLILLGVVFWPILAFGDATYLGSEGDVQTEALDSFATTEKTE